MPAPRGVPQVPRKDAGRPTGQKAIDALLTRLERHVTRLERAGEIGAPAVRLLRVRLHLLEIRLAVLDAMD